MKYIIHNKNVIDSCLSLLKSLTALSLSLYTDTASLRWDTVPSGRVRHRSGMFWSARGWSPITCLMWFCGRCAVWPVNSRLLSARPPWATATWTSSELHKRLSGARFTGLILFCVFICAFILPLVCLLFKGFMNCHIFPSSIKVIITSHYLQCCVVQL